MVLNYKAFRIIWPKFKEWKKMAKKLKNAKRLDLI